MPDVKNQTPEAWAPNTYVSTRKGSGAGATPGMMLLNSMAAQDVATFDLTETVVTVTGALPSLAAADHRKFLRFTHATPALTIPLQSTVAFADGFRCRGSMVSGGTINIPTGGTINGTDNASVTVNPETAGQQLWITRLASNAWFVGVGAAVEAGGAPLASPHLTGVPTAPTASALTSTTQLATTAFVTGANTTLLSGVTTSLNLKAPLASPTLTGTPAVPTAAPGTNTTQVASTAFVQAYADTVTTALALKAPLASPTLTGTPAAPTAAPGTNTTQLASTAFVTEAVGAGGVGGAPLASPALTGVPTAPTAAPSTNTTQLATTEFVTTADNLKAPLASPTFTGTPALPTAAPGTNTTQAASTAFVTAAVGAGGVGGAPLASPAFSGVPTAPTAAAATNTTQLATTAFVTTADNLKAPLASPTLTGTPAAPTAAPGTNTTQLANTAFVQAYADTVTTALALKAPLASPTLTGTPAVPTAAPGTNTTQAASTAFVTAAVGAGGAPLASPAFTGVPTAPTAAAATNTTQLATTAFVTTADNLKAPLASPTLTGTPAAPTATPGNNTTQLATTAFVTAADTALGTLKANLAGDTLTGQLNFSGTTHAGVKLLSLTTTQRNALTPANGMVIYNSTTTHGEGYFNGAWVDLGVIGVSVEAAIESLFPAETDKVLTLNSSGNFATASHVTTGGATDRIWVQDTAGDTVLKTVAASTIFGRKATGEIDDLTGIESLTIQFGTPVATRFLGFDGSALAIQRTGAQEVAALLPDLVGTFGNDIPAVAMRSRITNGATFTEDQLATNTVMRAYFAFDPSTDQYVQGSMWLPDAYNGGTITAVIYWSHPATTTNFGTAWSFAARAYADGESMDGAWGTAQTVTDTGGSTSFLYKTAATAAVTIAGTPAAGELMRWQLNRTTANGSDTLAVSASVHRVVIYVTMNNIKDA